MNKILEEYILKNTPQPPKDVSIIEIIADEVNRVLNDLPEIKLASEVLSEDELKDLFSPLAKQVVTNVYGQMEQNIKNLVEMEVDNKVVAAFLNGEQIDDAVRADLQQRLNAETAEGGELSD